MSIPFVECFLARAPSERNVIFGARLLICHEADTRRAYIFSPLIFKQLRLKGRHFTSPSRVHEGLKLRVKVAFTCLIS